VKRTTIARIDEDRCIGCTRCIEACPVDAIVGAHQLMHTWSGPVHRLRAVPASLPVDCIDMIAAKGAWTAGTSGGEATRTGTASCASRSGIRFRRRKIAAR